MVNMGLQLHLSFDTMKNLTANVMISDVGDNKNFGPEMISTELDMKILSK